MIEIASKTSTNSSNNDGDSGWPPFGQGELPTNHRPIGFEGDLLERRREAMN